MCKTEAEIVKHLSQGNFCRELHIMRSKSWSTDESVVLVEGAKVERSSELLWSQLLQGVGGEHAEFSRIPPDLPDAA